jgi:hypothetical protein
MGSQRLARHSRPAAQCSGETQGVTIALQAERHHAAASRKLDLWRVGELGTVCSGCGTAVEQ